MSVKHGVSDEEVERVRRLQAAAPDLLAALKRFADWSTGNNALTKHSDVMEQSQSAIRKAEQ